MTILCIYSSVILHTTGEEQETMYMLDFRYNVHVCSCYLVFIFIIKIESNNNCIIFFFDPLISRRVEYYASSLGFNACNFFLWDFIKEKLYTVEINNREEILVQINKAADINHQSEVLLEKTLSSLHCRIKKCIKGNKGYIKHFVKEIDFQ